MIVLVKLYHQWYTNMQQCLCYYDILSFFFVFINIHEYVNFTKKDLLHK